MIARIQDRTEQNIVVDGNIYEYIINEWGSTFFKSGKKVNLWTLIDKLRYSEFDLSEYKMERIEKFDNHTFHTIRDYVNLTDTGRIKIYKSLDMRYGTNYLICKSPMWPNLEYTFTIVKINKINRYLSMYDIFDVPSYEDAINLNLTGSPIKGITIYDYATDITTDIVEELLRLKLDENDYTITIKPYNPYNKPKLNRSSEIFNTNDYYNFDICVDVDVFILKLNKNLNPTGEIIELYI